VRFGARALHGWEIVHSQRRSLATLLCLLWLAGCGRGPADEPPDSAALRTELIGELAARGGLAIALSDTTEPTLCDPQVDLDGLPTLICAEPHPLDREALERLGRLGGRVVALERKVTARIDGWAADRPAERAGAPVVDARDRAQAIELSALWQLLWFDNEGALDRAVEQIQAAIRLAPESAPLHTTLAAAHLARGAADARPEDFLQALNAVDGALELESGSDVARFDRALALQSLALWDQAQEAWDEVRDSGRATGLGDAADQYLAALAKRPAAVSAAEVKVAIAQALEEDDSEALHALAAKHAELVRLQGEQKIATWGELYEHGERDSAERILKTALLLGSVSESSGGDTFVLGEAERITEAMQLANAETVETLAAGHAALGRARAGAAYSACSTRELEELGRAGDLLGQADSPFFDWAAVDQAICAFFAKSFYRATEILRAVEARATASDYRALLGRTHWMLGLVLLRQARFDRAIGELEAASEIFSELGEMGHVAYLSSVTAKAYANLGARRQSWQARHRALVHRDRLASSERIFSIFEEVFEDLANQNRWAESLYFLSEQLTAAEAAADEGYPDTVLYTLLDRAEALRALGDTEAARRDVERAEELWAELPEGHESRERLALELAVHRALGAARSSEQLAAIDATIELLRPRAESAGDQIEILKLLRRRADVELAGGGVEGAERDLTRAIEEVERQRREAGTGEYRARYLSQARSVFDAMAALQIDRLDDAEAALGTVERASNRVLIDKLAARAGASSDRSFEIDLDRLAGELTEGEVMLRYGQVGDRLLGWCITGDGWRVFERPIAARELQELVDSFRRQLEGFREGVGESGTDRVRSSPGSEGLGSKVSTAGHRLAKLLLAKELEGLPAGSPVTLVPSAALSGVPFAALPWGVDGERLVDRFTITVAPSLALVGSTDLYDARTAGDTEAPGSEVMVSGGAEGPESVLIIADPAFDTASYPGLSRLSRAAESGRSIEGLYREATVLAGADATAERVAAELSRHEVVHFAGHAIADPLEPKLLLAAVGDSSTFGSPDMPVESGTRRLPDSSDSGVLTTGRLRQLDLESTRVVVLAACSTAVGRYPESSEVADLATAFLAAGVPSVVASLWPVSDRASAALFEVFHRQLAAGEAPAEALRTAQLALRSSRDPQLNSPSAWAGFQVYGSNRWSFNR